MGVTERPWMSVDVREPTLPHVRLSRDDPAGRRLSLFVVRFFVAGEIGGAKGEAPEQLA
jgi:hypothetical protein